MDYHVGMKMNKLKWYKQYGDSHRCTVAKQKCNISVWFNLCKFEIGKITCGLRIREQLLLMRAWLVTRRDHGAASGNIPFHGLDNGQKTFHTEKSLGSTDDI